MDRFKLCCSTEECPVNNWYCSKKNFNPQQIPCVDLKVEFVNVNIFLFFVMHGYEIMVSLVFIFIATNK